MSILTQAILLGILGAYCWLDWAVGFLYLNRPIVLAPLVGLILGDVQTGLMLGAVLETFFLGTVVIGGYQAPDAGISSILASAFVIQSGTSVESALLLAVPIAVIMTQLQNILWAAYSFTSKIADNYAEKGNDKGVYLIMILEMIGNTLLKFFVVFFAWLWGRDSVIAFIESIPAPIIDGMTAAGGLLPAIGLAILMSMILNKKNAAYYILGFALAAYFNVPTIGVAVLGVILILTKFDFSNIRMSFSSESGEISEVDDNEF